MLEVLGVLVDENTFPAFNCEAGVDSQHLRGLCPRLVELPRLRIGGRQIDMSPLQIRSARCGFTEQTHRLSIALKRVIGQTQPTCRVDERLKRIEAHICLQDLDRSCVLARIRQDQSESMIDKIGIEREGALEFSDCGVVLVLPKQDMSKLSASLWQASVEAHRRIRQFKGAIERSGTEIIAVERFVISVKVSPGQHRSGARVIRIDREGLFEQTPSFIEQGFGTSALM